MHNKTASSFKDIFTLIIITLVAGLAVGFTYEATKGPIEKQKMAVNLSAYQSAFPDAFDFQYEDNLSTYVDNFGSSFSDKDFGNVTVNETVLAKDSSGNILGFVSSVTTADGYNGNITLAVGIKLDGTVAGVEMIEINETPGFGLLADEPAFKEQYRNKNTDYFVLTKNSKTAENEIDALSGATITSNAVTNAVNASIYFIKSNTEF